jgi:hypothetical protein
MQSEKSRERSAINQKWNREKCNAIRKINKEKCNAIRRIKMNQSNRTKQTTTKNMTRNHYNNSQVPRKYPNTKLLPIQKHEHGQIPHAIDSESII